MKISHLLALFFLFASMYSLAADKKIKICKNIFIESAEDISFNSNEILFICGKSEIQEWKNIPEYQTKIHLKASLQAKGYHFLKFKNIGKRLIVKTGPRVNIDRVVFKGLDIDIQQNTYIDPLGEAMTPNKLETIKGYFLSKLSKSGYPCANVDVKGFAKEKLVEVTVNLNGKRIVTKVIQQNDGRYNPALFSRYYAFELNKPYSSHLIELTNQRILDSGVVQHSQFSPQCLEDKNEVAIEQKILLGKAKTFSLGVGGSTEDGLLSQIKWKNARLGKNGSQANISLYTSFIQQRLQLNSKWYPSKNLDRHFLEPSIVFKRVTEAQFKVNEGSASILYGASRDSMRNRYEFKIGPAFNYFNAFEAALNTTQYYPSLKIQSSIMSHDFEFYLNEPVGGFNLSLSSELISDSVGADFNAYQFKLTGHYLKNIGNYYPAHLILGVRFGLMTTMGTMENQNKEDLPLKFRYFIGGARNLRGFGRQELPQGGVGSYSAFYTSVEARSYTLINPKWQPLAFIDTGLLGVNSSSLKSPLYWSPGLGVRWDSPIGVFRTTLAHGYISKANTDSPRELSHFQFFLSFGKEF